MFTTEIRINGALIAHVYGVNTSDRNVLRGEDSYRYEYYELDTGEVITGGVTHTRSDGIKRLLIIVLEDIERLEKE